MSITWKKGTRFKPEVILRKIVSVRTIDENGRTSFEGFDIEDCMPAIHSMLNFPEAAREVDVSTIVWKGLTAAGEDLNPATFLYAVNKELSSQLATRQQSYFLLTSASVECKSIPDKLRIDGAEITFHNADYPKKYRSRIELLRSHPFVNGKTPSDYCKITVKVVSKSPAAAVNKALRALDLQRALWCLMGNPLMEIAFGIPSYSPINVVRLGSQHTLHVSSGKPATDAIWFEPGFVEAKLFRMKKPETIQNNSKWAISKMTKCAYGEQIMSSLIRYVRSLDERDPNSAFLGLWGALESLTTPYHADYEKVVQRCSFLFSERLYHQQILEHLREYRNVYVHTGEASDRARTHCYQLQLYYVNLLWFYIKSSSFFKSLDEANIFLDSPIDQELLKRRILITKRALRLVAP